MEKLLTRKSFLALAFAMFLALGALVGFTPDKAFASTSYSLSTSATGDLDQHVELTIHYGDTVYLGDQDPMSTMNISIAGYDIKSDSYRRPVAASASGNDLILDIGNRVDSDGNPIFTAQYGSVIDVSGTPAGITLGDSHTAVSAIDAIHTVIPSGVEIAMNSGEGTNSLSATVDHAANVRSMVHIALYDGSTGSLVPVNTSTTAGNLHVGTYNLHAHNFLTQGTDYFASGIAGLTLPAGYSITANGSNLTVTGPAGSALYLYVFDDTMLQSLGWTFDGIVSNDGVMIGYLPD